MITFLAKLRLSRQRILLVGLLSALAILLVPNIAAAQDAITTSTKEVETIYQEMVTFLITVMEFLQRLIWPVLLMIGGLLKNDILFAAGMEEVMLSIWANIRNIVNILFVILLLGIAFYNVMGGSQQDYHIKTILPRFIIALIAVNFSFLGVKLVIDGVNVVSTAIFALPDAVEKSLEANKGPSFAQNICEGLYGKDPGKYNDAIKAAEDAATNDPAQAPFCRLDKKFTEKAENFFARFDSHNAAIVLAVNMAEVSTLDVVNVNQPQIKDLAINVLFSIVLYVVYAISFVVLLIVLLVRLVVLWVTMVLSPFIALALVLPESLKSSIGGDGDLKTQFVQNAIVPIPIAIVMSIGFIMLQSLKQAKFGNVSLETSTLGVNMLTSGLSTLQDVIVAVGTVTVIWVGVMKAAEKSAAKGIVGKIREATEGFGKFVATAPFKYAPIIPVTTPTGEERKIGLGTALGVMREVPYGLERARQQEISELAGGFTGENLRAAGEKMKQAKTPKEYMQELVNAGPGVERTPGFQAQLYESLRARPNFLNELNWKELRNKQGQEFKNVQEVIEALRNGDVQEESLKRWIASNQARLRLTPQAREKAPGVAGQRPGTTGAPPPTTEPAPTTLAETGAATAATAAVGVGSARALSKAGNYEQRKDVLNDAQKEALKKYDNASKDKKEEVLSDNEVQNAFKEIDDVQTESVKFHQDMADASAKENKDEREKQVVEVVIKRKKDVEARIKRNNPELAETEVEKRVNEIVQGEMNGAPTQIQRDVSEIKPEAAPE